MSMKEKDPVTGNDLTGHEWDGIKEMNTPVHKAFKIIAALGFAYLLISWVLYPSFPVMKTYFKGAIGYSSRAEVTEAVAEGEKERAEFFAPFGDQDVTALAADDSLKDKYQTAIKPLYDDNCAACHRKDLKGQTEFPNLTDAHWLWSGSPEEIELTLQHGINDPADDDTRISQMMAFGKDGILEKDAVNDVTEYVLSLTGHTEDAEAAKRGEAVFADNCASCHGDGGVGGLEVGAPSLTDDQWIYGSDHDSVHHSIYYGRQGVMPAWQGKLTDEEIKMLTLYVLWAADDDQN